MRERPILMSAPMVRAILAGTKTQTRRIVKHQPQWGCIEDSPELGEGFIFWPRGKNHERWNNPCSEDDLKRSLGIEQWCPYGAPGDRLWCRETHAFGPVVDQPDDWRDNPDDWAVFYRADGDERPWKTSDAEDAEDTPPPWRPAIHMPRWASRITLEVTSVRVERLHEITAADAVAEGVVDDAHGWDGNPTYPLARFRSLWREINGAESWSANPWVWVVGFKRVEVSR